MTGQWQCKRKSVTGTGHHLMMTLGAVSFTRSGLRCSDPSSWPQDEENKFPSTQPPDGTLLNSSWLTKTSWRGSGNVHESQSLATTGCWPWLLSPSHGAGCDAQTHLQWEMPGAWPVSLLAPPCSSPLSPHAIPWSPHQCGSNCLSRLSPPANITSEEVCPGPGSWRAQPVLDKVYMWSLNTHEAPKRDILTKICLWIILRWQTQPR